MNHFQKFFIQFNYISIFLLNQCFCVGVLLLCGVLYLTKICDRNNTQYILCVKKITQDRNRFNIDS